MSRQWGERRRGQNSLRRQRTPGAHTLEIRKNRLYDAINLSSACSIFSRKKFAIVLLRVAIGIRAIQHLLIFFFGEWWECTEAFRLRKNKTHLCVEKKKRLNCSRIPNAVSVRPSIAKYGGGGGSGFRPRGISMDTGSPVSKSSQCTCVCPYSQAYPYVISRSPRRFSSDT